MTVSLISRKATGTTTGPEIELLMSRYQQADLGFFQSGLTCMKSGLTYSIPGALFFWLLVRRGAILFPNLIGAAAGGLAGFIGLTVLEINCPNLDVYHVLVWHGGVVVISSVAGVLLGAAVEYIDRLKRHKVS